MMKSLIADLFGTYEPFTYLDANDLEIIPSGASGVDWVFISGVVLFAITLFCVFRLIGGFLKK